jgi:hypothetical protein
MQFSGVADFNFAERMRTGAPGISVNSSLARAAQSNTGLTIVLSGNGIISTGSLAAAGACAEAKAVRRTSPASGTRQTQRIGIRKNIANLALQNSTRFAKTS